MEFVYELNGLRVVDLSKPIDLNIHTDGSELTQVLDVLKPYIVEEK